MKGKDVHWGLPLHAELFRGESLENDLQSWQELCEKEGCALRNTIACQSFGGGKFRKWLAIVTRTLWKGRMCIEDYHCMQSFGGGSLENDLQSWQELCEREGCALRTTIACRALGGKFRKWLAIVTRTLWKGRMCIEEYHCMQSFGGGSLENDLQSWQELYAREGCALRTTIACRALGGGKFRKWLAIVTRTLWKGRMCIEDLSPLHAELWGGGSLENDLQWWQELDEREGCALRTTIACRALGGEV